MSTNIINPTHFSIILNLSTDRDDWEQVCTDTTAKTATQVAQSVLAKLQGANPKVDNIKTFIQKLELLNNKFKETNNKSPLTSIIQGLKIEEGKTQTLTKPIKAIQQSPAAIPSFTTPKEKSLQRLQEAIKKLDLASPHLFEQIEEIKQDLKKLEQLSVFSDVESFAISGLLDALKKGNTLFLHLPGDDLICFLSESHPELKIDYHRYYESKKTSYEQAQSTLLKIFKTNCDSPEKLSKALQTAYKQILNQTYQTRLSFALTSDQLKSECFNRHFMTNFSKLADFFERYTSIIAPKVIDKEIKKTTKELDDRSSGKFSKLVKLYSYLDMNKKYSEFIKFSQVNLIKIFDLNEINHTEPQNFDNLINIYQNYSEKITLLSFQCVYDESLKLRHEWLSNYADRIKKSYNQADDPELSAGCCFNNSLDRFWIISEFPDLPGKDIPMKSSQEGRFAQARTVQAFHRLRKKEITYEEAEAIQISAAERHGLNQVEKINVIPSGQNDSKQTLMDAISKVYQNNQSIQFILSLYNPGNAHAINIQFDESKNIFRIMDDNLGVCEFTNFADFQKGFHMYVKAFHSRKNQFIVRFFGKE